MDTIEPLKRLAEKATGIGIPSHEEALACVRDCRPSQMKFRDDGYIPNNPKFPLLYYRKAIRFGRRYDPAAVLEKIFNVHGWGDAWRNGIYDFVHYHSMIHEVLGIARGSATLRLGGNKGRTVKVAAGDAIIIPAGVGHECLKASREFLVVGAYPPTGTYNECRGSFQERDKAITSIRRVGAPKQNPLYGPAALVTEPLRPAHLHMPRMHAFMSRGARAERTGGCRLRAGPLPVPEMHDDPIRNEIVCAAHRRAEPRGCTPRGRRNTAAPSDEAGFLARVITI